MSYISRLLGGSTDVAISDDALVAELEAEAAELRSEREAAEPPRLLIGPNPADVLAGTERNLKVLEANRDALRVEMARLNIELANSDLVISAEKARLTVLSNSVKRKEVTDTAENIERATREIKEAVAVEEARNAKVLAGEREAANNRFAAEGKPASGDSMTTDPKAARETAFKPKGFA